jgi:hypothetical protein
MRTIATLIVLASVSFSGMLWAAEPAPASAPQPKPTATTPNAKPADAKPDEKAAVPVAQDKAAAPAATEDKSPATTAADAKPKAEQKASPQRFIPSEQVRADFDVSFPIDI